MKKDLLLEKHSCPYLMSGVFLTIKPKKEEEKISVFK
jgi:hypothetical protein